MPLQLDGRSHYGDRLGQVAQVMTLRQLDGKTSGRVPLAIGSFAGKGSSYLSGLQQTLFVERWIADTECAMDDRLCCGDTLCHGVQVSYAITAAARQAAGEGPPGKASPRKRPRTDDGGTETAQLAGKASQMLVEKASPIALAKAIKNKVCNPSWLYPLPHLRLSGEYGLRF